MYSNNIEMNNEQKLFVVEKREKRKRLGKYATLFLFLEFIILS